MLESVAEELKTQKTGAEAGRSNGWLGWVEFSTLTTLHFLRTLGYWHPSFSDFLDHTIQNMDTMAVMRFKFWDHDILFFVIFGLSVIFYKIFVPGQLAVEWKTKKQPCSRADCSGHQGTKRTTRPSTSSWPPCSQGTNQPRRPPSWSGGEQGGNQPTGRPGCQPPSLNRAD